MRILKNRGLNLPVQEESEKEDYSRELQGTNFDDVFSFLFDRTSSAIKIIEFRQGEIG